MNFSRNTRNYLSFFQLKHYVNEEKECSILNGNLSLGRVCNHITIESFVTDKIIELGFMPDESKRKVLCPRKVLHPRKEKRKFLSCALPRIVQQHL